LSQRRRAVWYLILTAILWSLGGVLIKQVPWHPVAIAGARSAIAALFLLAYARRFQFVFSFTQIAGALAYTGTVILFVSATKLTTAANAILLQYTAPVYVALLSAWVLHEKATRFDWLIIALVLCGMLLFFFDRLSTSGFWGNICAIASGVCFAWFVLLLRRQKDASPLQSIIIGNIITAIIGTPFVLNSSHAFSNWGFIVALGTLQLGVSYILYSIAIKHVSALEAILIPTLEPVLNPIWVLVWIGEKPGTWSLMGGVIVITAVLLRSIISSQQFRLKGS
jgi:drug/metabolite transporter (DMT)-like permease